MRLGFGLAPLAQVALGDRPVRLSARPAPRCCLLACRAHQAFNWMPFLTWKLTLSGALNFVARKACQNVIMKQEQETLNEAGTEADAELERLQQEIVAVPISPSRRRRRRKRTRMDRVRVLYDLIRQKLKDGGDPLEICKLLKMDVSTPERIESALGNLRSMLSRVGRERLEDEYRRRGETVPPREIRKRPGRTKGTAKRTPKCAMTKAIRQGPVDRHTADLVKPEHGPGNMHATKREILGGDREPLARDMHATNLGAFVPEPAPSDAQSAQSRAQADYLQGLVAAKTPASKPLPKFQRPSRMS